MYRFRRKIGGRNSLKQERPVSVQTRQQVGIEYGSSSFSSALFVGRNYMEHLDLVQQETLIPIFLALASAYVVYRFLMGNEASSAEEQLAKEPEPTRGYSRPDLTQYNGVDNERILIALKGTVYNVTQGKAFYGPGGSYHIFAGRDASRGLAKMSLEVKDVDDPSIDDLNLSEIDAMNNWAEKLAAKYPIVGHLVVPMEERDYTLEELAQYNGTDETKPLVIVMRGIIYDVTKGWNFYGPNGGYSFLGGRDASRALAKMSLDPSTVKNPVVLDDLTDEENKVLDDWIEKLSKKYKVVGNVATA